MDDVTPLENDEYLETQQQLLMLASLIRGIQVERFLRSISLCEATAPVLDPTMWIKGHKKLEEIKEIALGAQAFKSAVSSVVKKLGESVLESEEA